MATLPFSKDELSVNIKILNCRNLLIGDTVSSDPYVTVFLGKKELHKTKHLMKTLNPVFGTKDNNEFDAQFLWGDLTRKAGLTFQVKDWDLVGTDDLLGTVKISPSELLKAAANEEPKTLELEPPPNMKVKKGAGSITISIRHTSTVGVQSKYWAPPRASVAARRSTLKNPSEAISSSEEESDSSDNEAPNYNKELFVEIVSCKNLIAGDSNGLSDPYVKVQMGKTFLHRTGVIKHTLNPAFTAEHKNSFILDCSSKDLWAAGGIEFIIKDHDDGIAALGYTNDELGTAKISAGKLYAATGANMKLKITPPPDSREARRGLPAGSITIRVREATMEDKNEIKARSGFFKKTVKATPRTQAKKFIPEVDLTGIEKKILLIEVLSCRELLAADKNGYSDPYVLAKLGFKDLHKTDHIKRTLNPVYTSTHKNSFVVDCSVSELFGADGIYFSVIDWDGGIISGDEELGSVQVSATTLYECQEAEYHLDPPSGRNEDAGYLRIRITEITETQRDLHKSGKLRITKTPMPSGLSTSEIGQMSTTSLHSLDASFDFNDMPDKILLVEILSCRRLIAADKNGLSDPYVRAKMGKKELHKTSCVKMTLDPVFTSAHNNSFLITCSKAELAGSQGILVRVIDWDRGIGGDDDLGWVQISAESLYECRVQEYHLNAPYGRSEDAGYVTIRTLELTEEQREQYAKASLPFASKPPPPPPPPAAAFVTDDSDSNLSLRKASPTESPSAFRKGTSGGYKAAPVPTTDYQDVYKEPYDPDAAFIAAEEKKFKMLVAAVVASSILLVLLTVGNFTGVAARSGEPRVGIAQVGMRIGEPKENGIALAPSGKCSDLVGWTDSYGYGCDYYNDNQGDCEKYAQNIGSDGHGPVDACCICQNVVNTCFDLDGWIDFYEDSCDWYEENEPLGCPNEGHVNGTNMVNASQACCHCHTPAMRENDGIQGKLNTNNGNSTAWLNLTNEQLISLIVGLAILFCCILFCCCCGICF